MKRLNTLLAISPISTIISVHVNNMLNTPKIRGTQITMIISNLESTYGAELVEDTIASTHAEFYMRYYGFLKPLSKVG